MRIPPGLACDVGAPHSVKSREEIFDDSGQNMPDVRLVVRRWRTFVEDELLRAVFRLFERLGEDIVVFP